ncbi:MAG: aspartate 1-decarboxylase [Omnitrophica WOR_2 bacterium RIFOXYB2_FULL_38_16]|nr:MAG: aspartate 1-decarboxylase [Omnitrophica WOR_2 bacterium RIFOXYA12_FULL_38_10]OGX55708.1 MAG: aspartate 1-decarboxylase [Omnitrophica WOR_2 bacterium RIFOXYC2_FULL_38_12]OGX58928.1 MAG: aspartate 1-decarboxylase [Omnitrophica WOR_2 bacterium RIFOXYB2_FULL_38_16]HBG61478.1 aspartate 1-decarboxylase [Candidatus Omnitrophota bacterium]
MQIEMMKSKIGHATVTEAELLYEGSITVDKDLAEAVDILENEKVEVLNINNGNRFTTYVIKGEAGSGKICLNGPAARQGLVGDRVMILSYALIDKLKADSFKPKIIHLDNDNKIKS